jgi:hypothetical protein
MPLALLAFNRQLVPVVGFSASLAIRLAALSLAPSLVFQRAFMLVITPLSLPVAVLVVWLLGRHMA